MEAPSVEGAHDKFKDSVSIVGVAWAGDAESYAAFIARHSLTFPNLDDTVAAIYSRYGVPYQPAWVFIGRDGAARTVRGAMDESALESALGELAAG